MFLNKNIKGGNIMRSKVVDISIVKDVIKDGMHILSGGFLGHGAPENVIEEIIKNETKDLTVYSIDSAFIDKGIGKLVASGNIKTLVTSHIGKNPSAQERYKNGTMEVNLIPMGTFCEAIRAGGSGLGGVLTPTGLGTDIAKDKQIINVQGKDYLLQEPIRGDVSIVQACKADKFGNCMLKGTRINSNEAMALASDTVIVEAEEIVDHIDPNQIRIPGVLVDYIVKGDK
jgi:acetate CoA/acetoacetate CoA-transferase alpha subunit